MKEQKMDEEMKGIVERQLGSGWRVKVKKVSEERRDEMERMIWKFQEKYFVENGKDKEKNNENKKVLLKKNEKNKKGEKVRFIVEGEKMEKEGDYERIVVMLEGNDKDKIEIERKKWKELKEEKNDLKYWKKKNERRWESKE